MTNVLILTRPNDVHAIFTQIALEKKGHRAVLWHTADFPTQQCHSFELSGGNSYWSSSGINFEIKNDEFDMVWYRRPHQPILSDAVHPDDKENAKSECAALYQTFWEVIAPNAMWINPPARAKAANSKFLQLKLAAEVGLKVPQTLISNHPEKIKNFIEQSKGAGAIYKTLSPMTWHNESKVLLTYTKTVTLGDLPADDMLKMTPGIFQEKIQKAYELRITYFGDYPVAAKLRSQEHPKGIMDWRYVPTKELIIEEYKLPDVIDQQCRAFMKKLGIVFGCFDFIVTPEGEYYFLEVNEAGQFLWIEDVNPKLKMLDIFTEFLIQKGANFEWIKRPDSISLSEFEKETDELLKKTLELHIKPD